MKLSGKKILIISPHPDDEVIGCGGLLAKAKKEDAKVFVFYICVGSSRQLVTGKTDEKTRLEEMKKVAKECGFKYKVLFIGKEFVRLDTVAQKDMIDPIEDVIEEFKPDIVCIPSKNSYDQDHRAVYTACITALRPTPRNIRHFVETVLMFEEPYTWTVSNVETPNFYIDVSGLEDKKVEYMKLYKSQNRKEPFSRAGENLKRYLKIRGAEIGCEAAESYFLIRGIVK